MSDESVENTDVNTAPQADASESSTESTQDSLESKPPAEESSATKTPEDQRIPKSRLDEVIAERNQVRLELKEIKDRLTKQDADSQSDKDTQRANRAVERLMGRGVDKEVAELLAETMADIAEDRVERRVGPVEQKTAKREVDSWLQDFTRSHKDADEYQPEMERVFSALPESMKNLVVSDRLGLEMLYGYVKGKKAESELEKAKQTGRDEAYGNQGLKRAVSGSTNSAPAPKGVPTELELSQMSNEEYKELLKKVPFEKLNELMSKGS